MSTETSTEEKLKLACYFEVSKISKFVCENNTLLGELEMDKNAKQLIAELVWKKLQVYAEDLEAFAKHAKRSSINTEDVKLLVRRNPSLVEHVTKMAEDLVSSKETKKKKKKIEAKEVKEVDLE
ncbi:centromere protein S-like [Macrosteles quadrilineatus]|uniref:centromere protein S-like n=1 Tax=Macrosteles quadrilineatus TaxID=74068 RepID=UPI0023E16C62|nr:centromere protein S-like [Macrosteles quadrilineatus]XP_054284424.1 centromere protein S-like [Macrosteles quadrilineatus]